MNSQLSQQNVGTVIRQRRMDLGVSQQELAELAGLSVHILSNIETGKGNPTLAVMDKLLQVLGLDLHFRAAENRAIAPSSPLPP